VPPSDLTPESKVLWQSIHRQYEMDDARRQLLAIALYARDRAQACRAMVRDAGLMAKKGNRAHPLLATIRDAEKAEISAWKNLNLDSHGGQGTGRAPGNAPV